MARWKCISPETAEWLLLTEPEKYSRSTRHLPAQKYTTFTSSLRWKPSAYHFPKHLDLGTN